MANSNPTAYQLQHWMDNADTHPSQTVATKCRLIAEFFGCVKSQGKWTFKAGSVALAVMTAAEDANK